MARDPEYQHFLDFMENRVPDDIPPNIEVRATPKQVGWVKQRQVRRAKRNKGNGKATVEDLELVIRKIPRLVVSDEEIIHASRVWR